MTSFTFRGEEKGNFEEEFGLNLHLSVSWIEVVVESEKKLG